MTRHTNAQLTPARSIARELNCRRQLEKFKSHAHTHCRTKYEFFSITTKILLEKS